MDSVTWDLVVYLACFSALCWGVYFFLVLKEAGEREWYRYQMRSAFREMVVAMSKVGRATTASTDQILQVRAAAQRFSEVMARRGRS